MIGLLTWPEKTEGNGNGVVARRGQKTPPLAGAKRRGRNREEAISNTGGYPSRFFMSRGILGIYRLSGRKMVQRRNGSAPAERRGPMLGQHVFKENPTMRCATIGLVLTGALAAS